jgi:hypothetical protein
MKGKFIVTGFNETTTEREVRGEKKSYHNRNLSLAPESGGVIVTSLAEGVAAPDFGSMVDAEFTLQPGRAFGSCRVVVDSWAYAQGSLASPKAADAKAA